MRYLPGMQPTVVHAGVMDSQRPPLSFTLPVVHLTGLDRVRRAPLRPARFSCTHCKAMVELRLP